MSGSSGGWAEPDENEKAEKLRELADSRGALVIPLSPGLYWMALPAESWPTYRRALDGAFGKDSFRTVQTRENSATGLVWVVIEVARTIEVDPTVVGSVFPYAEGMTAESEGAWAQASPHWIHNATESIEASKVALQKVGVGITPVLWGVAAAGVGLWLAKR